MNWSQEEIELIRNNYHKGAEQLNLQNRSTKSIRAKARRLGLKVSNETKQQINKNNAKKRKIQTDYKVNDLLIHINEYSSYLLGLLWTDEYLHKKRNTLSITMLKGDLEELNWIFEKFGNWNIQDRKRKNRSESRTLYTYNPILSKNLLINDFDKKSAVCPHLLFKLISEKYQKYFFRGIIDGDGCFYVSYKNSTYQFSIASSYEQDWSLYFQFFKMIGLNPVIKRRIQKTGKSSILRITGRKQVLKLIDWLYDGYEIDKIGLIRKFNKSCLFKK